MGKSSYVILVMRDAKAAPFGYSSVLGSTLAFLSIILTKTNFSLLSLPFIRGCVEIL
jgi:hypothetical protein